MDVTLKDLVHNNYVEFSHYRAGNLYYNAYHFFPLEEDRTMRQAYQFTVPIEDTGNGTFSNQDKAITYMRWIRKALEDNTLTKI